MTSRDVWRGWLLSGLLLGMSVTAVGAAPPASRQAAGPAGLQAQKQDVDAKLAAARERHAALQAQLAQLEQQDAAQRKQLQQRDAEIASLQQELRAAGAPASAASASH